MLTAADDARAGIPTQRSAYGNTDKDIEKSIRTVAAKTHEGASTAAMKSFVGNVLKQAGFPKTVLERVSVILDFVRDRVAYAPDCPGTEQIQTAAVSLCVDGAPVCIPIGDCDDLVTAVATLVMAAGIQVRIVLQDFGPDKQKHVLVEAMAEDGTWIPLDPSTSYPAGRKARAVRESRVDPLEGASAQFIGIGGLPIMVYEQGSWQRANPNAGLGHPEPKGDSRWYRVPSPWGPASSPIPPEQVSFYANDWYFTDAAGAVWKHACCSGCASGGGCAGKTGTGRGGGGGHGGGGGGHGGGGGGGGRAAPRGIPMHAAPRAMSLHPGGGRRFRGRRFRRFFGGNWWDWDGVAWVVVQGQQCETWGPPLANPPADLVAEAQAQLAANAGQPVVETWTDGVLYLFSAGPVIRPCSSLAGLYGLFGVPAEAGLGRPFEQGTGLGLFGIVLPGDILAYRNAWQPYVMASITAMQTCAVAIDNVLANAPQGGVYDIYRGEAQALHQAADGNGLILQWWNKFAGLTDDQIVAGAADILRGHQTTVIEVNRLRNVAIEFGCKTGWPDPPSYFDQLRIIDRIEGLGILARGELGIAEKAANQFVDFVDRKTNQVVDVLTSPWFLGGAALLAGGSIALIYAPEIKAALARVPKKKAA